MGGSTSAEDRLQVGDASCSFRRSCGLCRYTSGERQCSEEARPRQFKLSKVPYSCLQCNTAARSDRSGIWAARVSDVVPSQPTRTGFIKSDAEHGARWQGMTQHSPGHKLSVARKTCFLVAPPNHTFQGHDLSLFRRTSATFYCLLHFDIAIRIQHLQPPRKPRSRVRVKGVRSVHLG